MLIGCNFPLLDCEAYFKATNCNSLFLYHLSQSLPLPPSPPLISCSLPPLTFLIYNPPPNSTGKGKPIWLGEEKSCKSINSMPYLVYPFPHPIYPPSIPILKCP